jgi:hypothetical protein
LPSFHLSQKSPRAKTAIQKGDDALVKKAFLPGTSVTACSKDKKLGRKGWGIKCFGEIRAL